MASRTAASSRRAGPGRVHGAALATLSLLTLVLASLGQLAATPAGASRSAPETVRLLAQTPFVHPPGGLLDVALTRSGPLASPDATIQLTLFSRLLTRDGLLAAIGQGGPSGAVSTTVPIAARCLPGGASVRVTVDVAELGARTASVRQCATRSPVLRVGCATGCDGVYPLRITVRGAGSTQSLVTLVTFASDSRAPLQLVWVLRVAGRDHGLSGAAGALGALASHPRVPASVDVQGVALAHGVTEPGGVAALAVLRSALAGSVHELLEEPYVPADLGALEASRLSSEVEDEFALTASELAAAHLPVAPSGTVTVLGGAVTPTSLDAASVAHFHHVVLTGADLSTDPSTTLSWGSPFVVNGESAGVTAFASDTSLSALSEQTESDPVLGATQFLGELAFLHFEEPNLPTPRVVTVLTNATNVVTAPFTATVLAGLAKNPVLEPLTASAAFSRVPVGANGFPGAWSLARGPSHPLPSATIHELRSLRLQIDALASSITGGATPIPTIDGMLLSAERVQPRSARAHQLAEVRQALAAQLAHFRIYNGPITLTATGSTTIPITVLSSAPYGVSGILELSSPRIAFPNPKMAFSVSGTVHSIRVHARALVNGDLPLSVRLVSQGGTLVLAHAMITVRVTGFSVVGLVLTILAAAVLAMWWARTLRRKRAGR